MLMILTPSSNWNVIKSTSGFFHAYRMRAIFQIVVTHEKHLSSIVSSALQFIITLIFPSLLKHTLCVCVENNKLIDWFTCGLNKNSPSELYIVARGNSWQFVAFYVNGVDEGILHPWLLCRLDFSINNSSLALFNVLCKQLNRVCECCTKCSPSFTMFYTMPCNNF